jgi:HAD superfamily hydrolase (TIGR01662 family)
MPLFLPHSGWHVKFKTRYEYPEEGESPLGKDWDRYSLRLTEETYPDEMVLAKEYDVRALLDHPEVLTIGAVWYYTTMDPVRWPRQPAGREIDACMGRSVLYPERDQALRDLAENDEPVRLLWGLWESGPPAARRLVRAVLDGDLSSLPVLADALEDAGHKDAGAVRRLSAPAPAPRKGVAGARRQTEKPVPEPAPSKESARPQQTSTTAGVRKATTQEVVLVGGMPAGGKTTVTRQYTEQGYQRLNRDTVGGKVDDLLPRLEQLLAAGESVVMDNMYATREGRAGAVKLAKKLGVPIRFVLMDTSLEDAQLNACLRMMERCGKVLHPEDHKQAAYKHDPNLFPVAVLYRYRKEFQEPTTAEGFAAVEKVKFVRQYPAEWKNKAVIFDFDGTLRTHEGKEKFPLKPAEVRALVERAGKVREYEAKGYLPLGASNQSGIAKGLLTAADAEACFAETLRQLGLKFQEVRYCPHKVPPISCYCRKPGPGMGVELIVKYKLDPRQCLYVGDLGTDASFAARCGFQFVDHNEFFRA